MRFHQLLFIYGCLYLILTPDYFHFLLIRNMLKVGVLFPRVTDVTLLEMTHLICVKQFQTFCLFP